MDEDVGFWPFDPSEKSENFVKALKERWGNLETFGIRDKVPEAKMLVKTWDLFHADWDHGNKDVDQLQTQEQNLNSAERFAESHGFKRREGDVVSPELADQSPLRGGFVAVDEAAKEAEKAAIEAAKGAGRVGANVVSSGLGAAWKGLSTPAKATVIVGGITVASLSVAHLADALKGKR